MEFLKKQGLLAWNFYREYLWKIHLWCVVAFVAVCALSGVALRPVMPLAEGLADMLSETVAQSGLMEEDGSIDLFLLFGHNLRATLTSVAMGLVPFVFLPVLSLVLNGAVVGAVLILSEIMGIPMWQTVLLGLAPHGIFEIPGLMLGVAMGLYLCRQMNGMLRKKPGTPRLEAILPHLARVTVFAVLPLLAAAAVVETAITPLLLALVA